MANIVEDSTDLFNRYLRQKSLNGRYLIPFVHYDNVNCDGIHVNYYEHIDNPGSDFTEPNIHADCCGHIDNPQSNIRAESN